MILLSVGCGVQLRVGGPEGAGDAVRSRGGGAVQGAPPARHAHPQQTNLGGQHYLSFRPASVCLSFSSKFLLLSKLFNVHLQLHFVAFAINDLNI
jgi:hypothetical protein